MAALASLASLSTVQPVWVKVIVAPTKGLDGGRFAGGGGGELQAARHMVMVLNWANQGSDGERGSRHVLAQHAPWLLGA